MKVPLHIVEARRERLALLIEQHRYLPIKELCTRLGVSEATARRDLAALVREKKITRTYGGALSEFNDRFPSFRERQSQGSRVKTKIGKAALSLIEPNHTYFFDPGTTVFSIAERFRDQPVTPVTIVTSSIPVGELLAPIPGVKVFQLAGQILPRQSVLVGETTRNSLQFWRFDMAFLSAEGMDPEGIWNSQAEVVEQQRALLRRTSCAVFCLDGSKLNRNAPHFLAPWTAVDLLLTDVPFATLLEAGFPIDEKQYRTAMTPPKSPRKELLRAVQEQEQPPDFPVHIL